MALLVVLFLVMTVTVVSLGFLARSDAELASGSNMLMHTQIRYLAESAITHAQGLLLNPQDSTGWYWTGDIGLQLDPTCDDYYDVSVALDESDSTDRCNYYVVCSAYRQINGEQTALIEYRARVRLDPAVGLYCNGDLRLPMRTTVYGDVYVTGDLYNKADINGDAYADSYSRSGTIDGGRYEPDDADATTPALNPYSYSETYTADADGKVELVDQVLEFTDTFTIYGDLVIDGGSLTVTAPKNTPAMIIDGSITLKNEATLTVQGYTQVSGDIDVANKTRINILGALHMTQSGEIDGQGYVTITVAPMFAALRISGSPQVNFSPASGAFIKAIDRQ